MSEISKGDLVIVVRELCEHSDALGVIGEVSDVVKAVCKCRYCSAGTEATPCVVFNLPGDTRKGCPVSHVRKIEPLLDSEKQTDELTA